MLMLWPDKVGTPRTLSDHARGAPKYFFCLHWKATPVQARFDASIVMYFRGASVSLIQTASEQVVEKGHGGIRQ
jgi:hypothetical protein